MPVYTNQIGPGKTGDGCIQFEEGYAIFPEGCLIKGNLNMRGVATVLNGQTTIAVVFDTEAADAPVSVQLTPIADPGDTYWITALTSAGFTINVGTAVGADTAFMWLAIF